MKEGGLVAAMRFHGNHVSPQQPQVNTGERGDQGVGIITTLV